MPTYPTMAAFGHQLGLFRDLQDRIRDLCARAVAASEMKP
jgi:hypothetical protein